MAFHNRVRELRGLAKVLPPGGAHLPVLYGRRRVGKAELLRHFYGDRPHLYYMGTHSTTTSIHVRGLSEGLGKLWDDRFWQQSTPNNWNDLLNYMDCSPGLDLPLAWAIASPLMCNRFLASKTQSRD